jgi:hypothetical protein
VVPVFFACHGVRVGVMEFLLRLYSLRSEINETPKFGLK